MNTPLAWPPADAATAADPFPMFARLRDEDPCHWSPTLKGWVLTRHADVKAACADAQRLSSDRLRPFFDSLPEGDAGRSAALAHWLARWMVFKDPPEHTRLRRVTSRVFGAKAFAAARPTVEAVTARLLEDLGERERFDFIAGFAGPLPCLVIMVLLGVPEADLPEMKRLSDAIALFIGSARASDDRYSAAADATHEMAERFRALAAARRTVPAPDLLSELVHLKAEDGSPALGEDDLVATCVMLLFAGHETTTNHLANGLAALLRFPAQMQRWRAEPALAARAVEELLRFDGPSGAQVRIVAEPFTLHGRALEPGQRVLLLLNAANRDERAWPEPETLDLAREGAPHLAFGWGIHLCLGFALARLEGQVALPAVLARWRHIEPDVSAPAPRWLDSLVFRGMDALPLVVRR